MLTNPRDAMLDRVSRVALYLLQRRLIIQNFPLVTFSTGVGGHSSSSKVVPFNRLRFLLVVSFSNLLYVR